MINYQDILNFWFQGINDQITIKANQPPFNRWFSSKPEFDQEIKTKFLTAYQEAKAGKYADWGGNPQSSLALILLFDQFSRNLFRNDVHTYATDSEAVRLSLSCIDKKEDNGLLLIERSFLYMPLMHAENIDYQQRSVECFTQLTQDCMNVNPINVSYYQHQLRYAQHHHDIIKRFGRFPHRNTILNRLSTAEEAAFLSNK